jgi:fatty acid desaturase
MAKGATASILRYSPLDALCLATIPVHTVVQLALALVIHRIGFGIALALLPLFLLMSLQNTGANHNHFHTPFSRNTTINDLIRIGFSLAGGNPKTPFNIAHRIHHDTPASVDDFKPLRALGLTNPLGVLKDLVLAYPRALGVDYLAGLVMLWRRPASSFAPKSADDYYGMVMTELATEPAQRRRASLETWAVAAFRLLLLALNYKYFLFIYVPLTHVAALVKRLDNYVQHFGATDWTDARKDSASCYGRLYNAISFNLGYHQEHHLRPGVHWLKLPRVTAELPSERRVIPFSHYLNMPWFFPLPQRETNPAPTQADGA